RCEAFAAALGALKEAEPDRYPWSFSLVPDKGHGGLPDRDLLSHLLKATRTAAPRHVTWRLSDGVVRDHYWLHVADPKAGREIDARLRRGGVLLSDLSQCELWLDARLVDMTAPLTVSSSPLEIQVTPTPSLRTLCATMSRRGDPGLAATWLLSSPASLIK
ncbi:MAG: hypothetical protein CMJ88_06680, partial [Planctomycetes bacterium]|nr:hypothetical protein [Planctomycetota bacterium]